MIRRPPRSTQSRSSAASDVYKRQGTIRASAGSTYPLCSEPAQLRRVHCIYSGTERVILARGDKNGRRAILDQVVRFRDKGSRPRKLGDIVRRSGQTSLQEISR